MDRLNERDEFRKAGVSRSDRDGDRLLYNHVTAVRTEQNATLIFLSASHSTRTLRKKRRGNQMEIKYPKVKRYGCRIRKVMAPHLSYSRANRHGISTSFTKSSMMEA